MIRKGMNAKMTERCNVLIGLAILFSWLSSSVGQEIGTEVCHCAPNTYEFTLDFSLFCPPVNITVGDAVAATTCMVSPFGDPNVTDLIPVAVQSIDILELDQNLQIRMQENIVGNFGDGDTFQYTSYAALPGEMLNPEDLPRAIQVNIIGVNRFDEAIINVYLITFTNSCGSYPVLFEGQSAGWTRFSDLGPPDREFCPLVPSDAPSGIPDSPAPSPEPSALPTVMPVLDPTPAPTPNPTVMPVLDPTPAPTPNPTGMPVVDPTPPPTPAPTPAPTTRAPIPTPTPSPVPVFSMSMSFSMSMDLRFGDLFATIKNVEDAAGEFGRQDTIIRDAVGIRGSQIPTRPRSPPLQKLRNQGSVTDAECDDYPCAGASTPEDSFRNEELSDKSNKSDNKNSDRKKEKKEKKHKSDESQKAKSKLSKKDTEGRLLSSLYDTIRLDEIEDKVDTYTYGARR